MIKFLYFASLKKYRRYAYVGCFILAALLTPPDILTQCLLAGPLIFLFEVSVLSVKLVEPKVADV